MIANIEDLVDPNLYGNKAYWLSWLQAHGYPVPYAIFLPAASKEYWHRFRAEGSDEEIACSLIRFRSDQHTYQVAVRSSATIEDGNSFSSAGRFATLIGEMTLDKLLLAISEVGASLERAHDPAARMGVIIQHFVVAHTSGVAFSSNPISGTKLECVVVEAKGGGEAIVSGRLSGNELVFLKADGPSPKLLTLGSSHTSPANLLSIVKMACAIEESLAIPVDIEWCVDASTGVAVLVQCRPATGRVFRRSMSLIPVQLESAPVLPPNFLQSSKVSLRLRAEQLGVAMSPAHICSVDLSQRPINVQNVEGMSISGNASAVSVVLISPQHLKGNVIRKFASTQNVRCAIEEIATLVFPFFWVCSVIIQEVYDATYTGIVRRTSSGFVVDIALGHFVPKGIVSASEYITDLNGVPFSSHEVLQDRRFRILEGSTIEEVFSPSGVRLSVSPDLIGSIITTFKPFLDDCAAVEFGILSPIDTPPIIYLIDIASGSAQFVEADLLKEGVLSPGRRQGIVEHISTGSARMAVDRHFHDDAVRHQSGCKGSRIFFCDTPDISLLDLLDEYPASQIAFVFREATALCHLLISLRENDIPAIRQPEGPAFHAGSTVEIDALTSGVPSSCRIKILHD